MWPKNVLGFTVVENLSKKSQFEVILRAKRFSFVYKAKIFQFLHKKSKLLQWYAFGNFGAKIQIFEN